MMGSVVPKTGTILRSKAWIVPAVLIIAVIILRIMLPHIVLSYVNRTLDETDGYRGRVEDIDIHLWRGSYTINGLTLEKTDGEVPVPLIDVARIDLSVQWSEIFQGALVGDITFFGPELNFVKGPTDESSQTELPASWIEATENLFPFSINELNAVNGTIHYRDFHSDPEIDIFMDNVYLHATNLTNSRSVSQSKFAKIMLYNRPAKGDPEVEVTVDLDTFAAAPTFEMKFLLNDLALTRLNDFLRAYGNFDVQSGTFSLYSEVSAAKGSFEGYVKPLFKDLDVVSWKEDKNPLELAWEAIVGAAGTILENPASGRVATRIPISGDFEQQDIGYWTAIGNLLRNAFIQAISPGFQDIGERDG